MLPGDGNDTAYGGADNDTIRGGNGSDVIYGEAGHGVVVGDAVPDSIFGGDGNDLIYLIDLCVDYADGGDGFDKGWVDPIEQMPGDTDREHRDRVRPG